jgi:hypothetical protein
MSYTYTLARCCVQCYRAPNKSIIKVFIWGPDKSAFYAYVYIIYVHSICITEHYIRMHVYKRQYICSAALEAAKPTVFMVWLQSCISWAICTLYTVKKLVAVAVAVAVATKVRVM